MSEAPTFMDAPLLEHLSVSAVRKYFTDQAAFWRTYIAKAPFTSVYTYELGKAWAKLQESYWRGAEDPMLITETYFYENVRNLPDAEKEDRDPAADMAKMQENFEIYKAVKHEWQVEGVEVRCFCPSPTPNGFPMKGAMDKILTGRGILDDKYVSKRGGQGGEGDEGLFFHYVQAFFYYHLYFGLKGEYPLYFIKAEFKSSKNKDGTPQYQERMILYEQEWLEKLAAWYDKLCIQIRSQKHYLPNPFQSYGAEEWSMYLKGESQLF